jgi:hypothetical protein
LHNKKVFYEFLGEWVAVNIDLEDQPQTVDSGDIYHDFKMAQETPPVLLKELNTQIIIQAGKLMTKGSLVLDRAEPLGALMGFQSAVTVVILKAAKNGLTNIDEQLSLIAAMSIDNWGAVAQMACEAEIFLVLKAMSTRTSDGKSDHNFFEKIYLVENLDLLMV